MFKIINPPDPFPPVSKSKQMDIIEVTKDSIIFLTNIRNGGMITQTDGSTEYTPFLINQSYRDILEDSIIDLSADLVKMNKHLIKGFSKTNKIK